MSWSQLEFVVDATDVEKISALMEAFLAAAVTTENAGEDEFYEVAFPGTPDWNKVKITALFDQRVDLDPIADFVQNQFANSEIPIAKSRLVDQDWERVWLSSFKPIEVGTDLWVCPSWCEPINSSARNIVLDPGLAFGTGTHATTFMVLNWLADQNLKNQRVLDYGSGSGILAIAALFSGANQAVAVDIDPLAVKACDDNAKANSVSSSLSSFLPDQLPQAPSHSYQLVIANILAEVIVELRDVLLQHLAESGKLLLTGILDSQVDRVVQCFGNDFTFTIEYRDQWALLIGSKHGQG